MTPEQKKEYFEMVTDLIGQKESEVDELLSGLRISIGNSSVWVEMKNIPFWKRGEFREIVAEKLRRQKAILEERHIDHLKSLLDQAVVAQLKNTWEEGKKRQSTNNSGISEPAIGKKPDAPPPSQKHPVSAVRVATFGQHGECVSTERVALLQLSAKQEKLWAQWQQGLNAHRKEAIPEEEALTGLLEVGLEYVELGQPAKWHSPLELGLLSINLTGDLIILWSQWLVALKDRSRDLYNGPKNREAFEHLIKLGIAHVDSPVEQEAKP